MRAEAQAREEAARREREARGEAAPVERPSAGVVEHEPVAMPPRAAEEKAVAAELAQESQPAPQPEAPRVDTHAMLESSGLQMVETRADRAPPTAPAEEPVQLGRPRRERPRPSADEQLVQVETKQ
jgi:hypothetical protein